MTRDITSRVKLVRRGGRGAPVWGRDKARALIVEDHAILREGLRALLCADPGLEVVGEAGDGVEAIRRVGELMPDLVLLDLSMPGMTGLEAIRGIRRRHPPVKVLVLTVHKTEQAVLAALDAGADGYVLKDGSYDELMAAITSILAGETYISPTLADKVLRARLGRRAMTEPDAPCAALTARERQVLKLVAEGKTSRQIASYFSISIKTVEKHRANLMKKLRLHNVSALTTFAIEKGLIAL